MALLVDADRVPYDPAARRKSSGIQMARVV